MMITDAWPGSSPRRTVDLLVAPDRHRVGGVEREPRLAAAERVGSSGSSTLDGIRTVITDVPLWQSWGYGVQVTITVNGASSRPWSASARRATSSAAPRPAASSGARA